MDNPIHHRSGHALRQLVLALLLKHDHVLHQQQHAEEVYAAAAAQDASRTPDQLAKRREKQAQQQATALASMANLLQSARDYTAEFQYSWRFADVKFPGWSDRLDDLQSALAVSVRPVGGGTCPCFALTPAASRAARPGGVAEVCRNGCAEWKHTCCCC